jgi:hypothetical protein
MRLAELEPRLVADRGSGRGDGELKELQWVGGESRRRRWSSWSPSSSWSRCRRQLA